MRAAVKHARRWFTMDSARAAVGGNTVGQDVRSAIEVFKTPTDPENMGRFLGGDDTGLGTDCAHLEGPESEARNHSKIGAALDQLFPAGFVPPENALEIAKTPTVQELQAQEENEILKEKVRERYRQSVELRQQEKDRIERASKHLEAAINGTSITQTMKETEKTTPPVPGSKRIYDQFGESDPFDAIEAMGDQVEKFLGDKAVKMPPTIEKDTPTRPTGKPSKVSAEGKPPSQGGDLAEVEAVRMLLRSMGRELEEKVDKMVEMRKKGSASENAAGTGEAAGKIKVTLRERLEMKKKEGGGKPLTGEDKLRLRILELEAKNIEMRMEKERERMFQLLRA
eukprot:TRINITY_DN11716_c0_g1_i1.p1 TRINITY_DN11716_c0_g1~~TRINITY_DN11716_c0_g1_i1.p1  ORF type:complete len:351 (+),score=80.98 TRINITY_DN11716_c0_g1_i1:34-1053(+)